MRYLLLLIFIASCSKVTILQDEVAVSKGNDYYTALATGYNSLSEWEEKQYDWADADLFAKKGLRAMNHQYVAAENPLERDIVNELRLEELIVARNKMTLLITNDIKFKFPLKTAHIQILYDTWVEQTEESWQEDDIRKFAQQFKESIKELEESIELAKERKRIELVIDSNNYHNIYFDNNVSYLDYEAREKLNQIIVYLHSLPYYKIILEGYTDLSGNAEYNRILSQKRIESVKNAMINNGIYQASFIKEKALGSASPKVPLKSGGKNERQNRRVEIYIITQ